MKCHRCNEDKPAEKFCVVKLRYAKRGRSLWCLECRNAYQYEWRKKNHEKYTQSKKKSVWRSRLKKFGVPSDWYEVTLKKQRGRCAICGAEPNGKQLCIDHDHSSGAIRGLLCATCNLTIGSVGENKILLRRMITYLNRYTRA